MMGEGYRGLPLLKNSKTGHMALRPTQMVPAIIAACVPVREVLWVPRAHCAIHPCSGEGVMTDLTKGRAKAEAHGAPSNDIESALSHAACMPDRHQLCHAG